MGQLTQTTAQVQVILDDADAANVGKTSLTDSTDTTAVAVKKSGFYSLGASSSNAPSTDRAILISAVRDTAATGEIRYGQVAITESNGMWWNRDDGGALGTWYEAVSTTGTQTLTNKTLTSPVLTTPQINDTSADHQYIFAVSELVADRTVTLPLLTGNDTFVFAAHTQTLTNKTLTSPVFNTGVSGSAVLDDDNFLTASSTTLATSESIKAYVDAKVTGEDLDFAGDTGTGAVDLDSQTFTIAGTANEIETSATGQTLTIGLPNSVTITTALSVDTISEKTAAAGVTVDSLLIKDGGITAAGTSTFAGQTISDLGTVTTANIDGGSIDGTTIGASTAAAGTFTSVTADGLTVSGDSTIGGSSATANVLLDLVEPTSTSDVILGLSANGSNRTQLRTTQGLGTSSDFRLLTVDSGSTKERFKIDSGGDISFYEDTGTTAKFFWDASTERLDLSGSDYQFGITQGANQPWYLRGVSDGSFRIHLNATGDVLTIDSSGRVGISVVPTAKLDIDDAGGTSYSAASAPTATVKIQTDGSVNSAYTSLMLGSRGSFGQGQANYITSVPTSDADSALAFSTYGSYAAAERMRIDSSGNVGIGTSSPDYNFHVSGTGDTIAAVTAGASSVAGLNLGNSTNKADGGIRYDNSADALIFRASNAEKMRIDSSGNVGIGTSNATPSNGEGMCIGSSSAIVRIDMRNSTTGDVTGDGTSLQLNGNDFTIENREAGYVAISTSLTERMRIDSSGDWIVSNTVANVASNYASQGGCGWVESDNHFEIATTSDRSALELGKNNANDGAIVTFRKQSTPVGSIGTEGGDLTIGTGAVGIQFGDAGDYIRPWNTSTNANRDASIDLGVSTSRFKDLYLSGGVYVGGTGAANYLDDYEEGTFTVGVAGSTTAGTPVYGTRFATYTKVGRSVTVSVDMPVTSVSGATGEYRITGLPFVPATGTVSAGSIMTSNLDWDQSTGSLAVYAPAGTSEFRIYISNDNVGWDQQSIDTSSHEIIFTITYVTT